MGLHESFWTWRNFRYLKAAVAGLVLSLVAYVVFEPATSHNGGTVYGLTMGTLCGLLVVWLTWFGVRKRSYAASGAPLVGWLSAHVYLGLLLIVWVPLHSGFEFGQNLHTFAYVVLVLTILSGIVGVSLYGGIPAEMTANRPGEKLATLLERIAELDSECRLMASSLPDEIAKAVQSSIEKTFIGGSLWRQLSGDDPKCATRQALVLTAERLTAYEGEARTQVAEVVDLLRLKRTLLKRVRRDAQLKGFLHLWLIVHVPLALGTVAAVAAHVVAVFYYA
ncbi:MAG: hypothetical protein ACI8TX_001691 [Hyphomicrobiaceae bacterium]